MAFSDLVCNDSKIIAIYTSRWHMYEFIAWWDRLSSMNGKLWELKVIAYDDIGANFNFGI